ncbi:MAG: hypothetical protein KDD56_09995 [Bdellovibrionales bacterium]|nr:hypothetical protein [Bdellovibrionales bacterium]
MQKFTPPLSWTFDTDYYQSTISIGCKNFIPWGRVQNSINSSSNFLSQLQKENSSGFILNGCYEELAEEFIKIGGKALSLGESAEIIANKPFKKSVLELAKRASNQISIINVNSNIEFEKILTTLLLKYKCNNKIINLFRDDFQNLDFCIAAYCKNTNYPKALI